MISKSDVHLQRDLIETDGSGATGVESERRRWEPSEVFDLVQGTHAEFPALSSYQSLHNHPRERVTDAAEQSHREAVIQTAGFHAKVGGRHGTLEHSTRPFPKEWTGYMHQASQLADRIARGQVDDAEWETMGVSPDQGEGIKAQVEAAFRAVYAGQPEAFARWTADSPTWDFGGNFGKAKDILPAAIWDMLVEQGYRLEIQTVEDLVESGHQIEEAGLLKGLELDVSIKRQGGDILIGFEPSLEQIDESGLRLDYLVVSVHPHSLLVERDIVDDSELLCQAHEKLFVQFRTEAPLSLKDKPVVLGHPFWFRKGLKDSKTMETHETSGMRGFRSMSREQKERIVEAAVANDIAFEINLDIQSDPQSIYDGGKRKSLARLQDAKTMQENIAALDPEFVELMVEHGTAITFDTDLHIKDYLDKMRSKAEAARRGDRSRESKDALKADVEYSEIQDLIDPEKGTMYRDLPVAFRRRAYQFVRTLQHLLNQGIQPEQILNLKRV
ncbi:hypothetical protein KKB83_05855 [Patescibacteria group bacterium]|nr:hypothetical protein [Patescibacteria group bacterium]